GRPRAAAARHRRLRRLSRARLSHDLRGGLADLQDALHVHVGHHRRGEVRRAPQDDDVGGPCRAHRLPLPLRGRRARGAVTAHPHRAPAEGAQGTEALRRLSGLPSLGRERALRQLRALPVDPDRRLDGGNAPGQDVREREVVRGSKRPDREVGAVARMRIATWNVNSLKARLEKVTWWLNRAKPDVLLMQETKLTDADAPADVFKNVGYELVHHGEGRWNGVAIASRGGGGDVVANLGGPLRPPKTPDVGDDEPPAEARMVAAVGGGVGGVSLYARSGRVVGSPFYLAKLAWFERLARWLADATDAKQPLVLGGDFNVAPTDDDVWDPAACHGGTHVSDAERAAFSRLCEWGLLD